jgi:lipoprotein-anchoring transpeptidase ErfK/SrfK
MGGFVKFLLGLVAIAAVLVLGLLTWGYVDQFQQVKAWSAGAAAQQISAAEAKRLPAKVAGLTKRLETLTPRGLYILIDTAANRLYLKKGDQVVREAVVSCGSGGILREPNGKRSWIFDTPRGQFHVESKLVNPYWVKPDWAFIEEGEPIPKNMEDRIAENELGAFALGFGKGYFIHGTLYTRLLGRNVTHGCVRVGDDDLKAVFESVNLGTRILIY